MESVCKDQGYERKCCTRIRPPERSNPPHRRRSCPEPSRPCGLFNMLYPPVHTVESEQAENVHCCLREKSSVYSKSTTHWRSCRRNGVPVVAGLGDVPMPRRLVLVPWVICTSGVVGGMIRITEARVSRRQAGERVPDGEGGGRQGPEGVIERDNGIASGCSALQKRELTADLPWGRPIFLFGGS